jgi:L-cysteine desulfidase
VEDSYEKTIQNIGRVGRQGMKSTDVEILNIMIGK